MPLEPGERNRLVTVQRRQNGTSPSGFPVDDWTTLRSRQVWMKRIDGKGAERQQELQVQSSYDTRWQMGYASDMDPELLDVTKDRRLVWKGRVLNIVSGSVIGSREGIELMTIANPSGETA